MAITFAFRAAIVVASLSAPALAQPAATPPDPALIESTVDSLAQVIRREYFDEAVTTKVEQALKTARVDGRYASVLTHDALAQRLTADLFSVTRDKHLTVAVTRPADVTPPGGESQRNRRDQPTSAGFRRVEILPGNVGYLDLTMFLRPLEHRDALAAAMLKLRPAEALILDMRDNGGGSPGTVALLISYLFDQPALPLFEVIPRSGDVERYATEPATSNIERNGTRPVWVLTSRRTFSGGEGLAFLLQERQRAQVVGEPTAGAANPGRPYPVNRFFEVTVPNAYIRSAIKHRNWEGAGVTPDVAVPATDALAVALVRARQRSVTPEAPIVY